MSQTPPGCVGTPPGQLLDFSGSGTVVVTPEDLALAAGSLARAADLLRGAALHLVRAAVDPLRIADPSCVARIGWSQARLLALAEQVEVLAGRTAATGAAYAGADDSGVQLAGTLGGVLGDNPVLLLPAALLAAQGVATVFGAELMAGALTGRHGSVAEAWTRTTGELTQDGRAAVLTGLLAGVVQGLGPGRAPARTDVPTVVAGLRTMTGDPPPAVTVPLDEAPDLPAPTGLADAVSAVDQAYGVDGRTGVILVQRTEHEDGPPSWLVAIPGTQSGALGGDTVTDMTTNLALEGGVPDQMTGAVLDAMEQAGIAPGDPVVLSGHSQGGMTAQAVAVAAGSAYSIRSVVTFGSPTIPQPMPCEVRVFALEQTQDAVPDLDGRAGTPTAPNTLVVRGDAATDATGPVPGPAAAHERAGYEALARLADESMRQQDLTVPGMEGAPGASTTTAYQATREAAVVATVPPTMTAAP
ncbi:MAG: hypothetical protein KJ792_03525 [Actinobacteria bacterium]|nr:hypothetical protein [Actinomycetota bacterium]